MTTTATAKYQTPVGGFDTWEDAAQACERADLDPCTCIQYAGTASQGQFSDVCWEHAYGSAARLSFAIRCF